MAGSKRHGESWMHSCHEPLGILAQDGGYLVRDLLTELLVPLSICLHIGVHLNDWHFVVLFIY